MSNTESMKSVACDLMDIAQAAAGCTEQFSGLGPNVYVAYPEDLLSRPEYDRENASFSVDSFVFREGRGAWRFRIKKHSGQIQSSGNNGARGWNVQAVFVIDRDVVKASRVLRILKNRGDAIFFFENPAGGYFVVYDPVFGTDVNSNYDSGTTPDSDSGHTVTVTCNPCLFPLVSWAGTLALFSEVPPYVPKCLLLESGTAWLWENGASVLLETERTDMKHKTI